MNDRTQRLLWIAVAGIVLAALPAAAEDATTKPASTEAPHLACERILREVAAMRPSFDKAAAAPDLEGFLKLHVEAGDKLRAARDQMESALVKGAWRTPPFKQQGFDLTWRIDAAQTLNFIAHGFGTTYRLPTGKVSPSVRDATSRLLAQVDHLVEDVNAVNRQARGAKP